MPPAKRKPTDIPAPTRRSARLSNKRTKMTTEKCDTEIKHEKQAARTRAPTVQVPHDCKEKLDELTRVLEWKTLGSTGYSEAPMHSPPFRTPQFSQNPQGVTSTGGLGTGSTAGYSLNLYLPAFTPTGGLRRGSSADTANVPEEKERDVGSRLKLSSIAIHKFLLDKTTSSEKSIREACGDSPDTSKALRELVKANKVQRLGRGGRADPYVYMVMLPISDLELLKEGQATKPPDSIEK